MDQIFTLDSSIVMEMEGVYARGSEVEVEVPGRDIFGDETREPVVKMDSGRGLSWRVYEYVLEGKVGNALGGWI